MQFENVVTDAVEVYLHQTDDFFQYVGDSFSGRPEVWPTPPKATTCETTRCPHCLHEFEYIETHWEFGGTCTPPMLSWRQHEIIEGVLLGGGTLEPAENGFRVAVSSGTPDLLEGLDETFGVLSAGIHETPRGSTWFSRATPELRRFATWLDEDGTVTVPDDLHHTKDMLRVAYALAGEFVEGRPQFTFHPTIDSDAFAEAFFDDFDPLSTPNAIVLRNVSEFFAYVGWIPLPGCEHAWPN
jgi:hypothetical protein